MVENDDFATKREAYYVSKNWGECKFNEQTESDTVMDDIEALASLDGLSREQLRYYPEEHGGSVAGNLVVIDRDPESGRAIRIDCTGLRLGLLLDPALGRAPALRDRAPSSSWRSRPAACSSA